MIIHVDVELFGALFERRLCRRNAILGEVSEGAVEAPSE